MHGDRPGFGFDRKFNNSTPREYITGKFIPLCLSSLNTLDSTLLHSFLLLYHTDMQKLVFKISLILVIANIGDNDNNIIIVCLMDLSILSPLPPL